MTKPLLQSIKETMSLQQQVSVATATGPKRFAMLPAEILARADLRPSTRLVFAAMRMESYGSGGVTISHSALALKAGVKRLVALEGIQELESAGLIEKYGNPMKQIQPYRIVCDGIAEPALPEEPSTLRKPLQPLVFCQKCRKRCRGSLGASGFCRECVEGVELPGKVAQALADLGANATPDAIAVHLKMRRLSGRIRRILEATA